MTVLGTVPSRRPAQDRTGVTAPRHFVQDPISNRSWMRSRRFALRRKRIQDPRLPVLAGVLASMRSASVSGIFLLVMEVAGIVAVVLLGVLAVFQVALALAAPLGQMAWGGRHEGVLPKRLRVASGVAGVLFYPLLVAVVLAASGWIVDGWLPGDGVAVMWILSVFFGLGTLVNAVSPSKPERIWSPVSLVMAICCAVIALAR